MLNMLKSRTKRTVFASQKTSYVRTYGKQQRKLGIGFKNTHFWKSEMWKKSIFLWILGNKPRVLVALLISQSSKRIFTDKIW